VNEEALAHWRQLLEKKSAIFVKGELVKLQGLNANGEKMNAFTLYTLKAL